MGGDEIDHHVRADKERSRLFTTAPRRRAAGIGCSSGGGRMLLIA